MFIFFIAILIVLYILESKNPFLISKSILQYFDQLSISQCLFFLITWEIKGNSETIGDSCDEESD